MSVWVWAAVGMWIASSFVLFLFGFVLGELAYIRRMARAEADLKQHIAEEYARRLGAAARGDAYLRGDPSEN